MESAEELTSWRKRPPGADLRETEDPEGLPAISDVEDEMLDCTASERCANSRLSCQLQVLEDITVRLPETQI